MRRLSPMILALLLIPAARLDAALPTVDELTGKMTTAALERKTYSADMKLTIPPTGGLSVTSSGKITGKNVTRDGKVVRKIHTLVESAIRVPGGQQVTIRSKLVTNGEVTWIESRNPLKPQVRVVKHKTEKLAAQGMQPGQDPVREMEAFKEMYSLKVVEEDEFDGVKVYVLEGDFRDEYLEKHPTAVTARKLRKRIRIYVGQDDMFTRKVKAYDEDGSESLIREFTNVKFNKPVDDALFEYTPPKGAKVQDLSK